MMMRGLFAATALAAALTSVPAAAQSFTAWESESGAWSVDGEDGDCMILASGGGRNLLAFSLNNKDADFYVRFETDATAGVPERQEYPLTLTLDQQRFVGQGARPRRGSGIGAFITNRAPEVARAFGRANRVTVTVDSVGTLEMAIDPEARRQFAKCQAAIGGIGQPSAD